MAIEPTLIYGKHAVREALMARPDVVRTLYVSDAARDGEMNALLKKTGIKGTPLDVKKLPRGVPADAVHQGLVASIDSSTLMQDYDDFVRDLTVTNDTAFVLLGEVQVCLCSEMKQRGFEKRHLSTVIFPSRFQCMVTLSHSTHQHLLPWCSMRGV